MEAVESERERRARQPRASIIHQRTQEAMMNSDEELKVELLVLLDCLIDIAR